MNQTEDKNLRPTGQFVRRRPRLVFYHPNGKGTGGALAVELCPAQAQNDGCMLVSLANQSAIGDRRGPEPMFARFDWENSLGVKLDFNDLCKILQVLRGECEAVEDGKGLYHRSVKATTRIVFRHLLEPVAGYSVEVYRSLLGEGEGEVRARILLTSAEALGLCEAIAGSMAAICFGVPRASAEPVAGAAEIKAVSHAAA